MDATADSDRFNLLGAPLLPGEQGRVARAGIRRSTTTQKKFGLADVWPFRYHEAMQRPGNGNGKGPTVTDPGSSAWLNRDSVIGLRLWGTNVEHDFPVPAFKRIWIGKEPEGDDVDHVIRINHETVSRKHATIEWSGPHLVVVDQGSKNGTFSSGEPQGMFELVAGAVVRFGAVDMVAYNTRTQKIRAELRRFLGYNNAAQPDVERVQHGAMHRDHFALVGDSGSGGLALARFIHETATPTWPFIVPTELPGADDLSGQRALVASAGYGTLVLDAGRRGVRAEKLPRVFELIASNDFHVRLVVLAGPNINLENVVGDSVRSMVKVVPLPALEGRTDELPFLLSDTIKQHCAVHGVASGQVHPDDVAMVTACITGAAGVRRARARIETFDELAEVIERLVVLRSEGSATKAEDALGLSHGAMSKWATKYGIELAAPGRPASPPQRR